MNLRRGLYVLSAMLWFGLAGCGVIGIFPAGLRDTRGALISVEQLDAISMDSDATEDDIRQQFLEIGIEDEDFVDAWLER